MIFEELKSAFIRNNLDIDEEKVSKLKDYWDILLFYQNRIHLFSKKSPKEELARQFFDIVLLNVFLPNYKELVDAGAGAGFVGIILSILNPKKQYLLVERSKKKGDFLDVVRIKLDISNIEIFITDLEHFSSEADVVVSKASCMRDLLENKMMELIKVGGILVHFTGSTLPPPYKNYPFKNPFRDNISYLSVLERVV